MKPLYYLCIFLLFTGCSPERAIERATRTAERAEKTQQMLKEKYPELVAEKFAEWFPATETETIIRDTVLVPTVLKEEPVPSPELHPETYTPAPARPARTSRPVLACPDLTNYTSTISALRQKMQQSAAALKAADERYHKVQHVLVQEREAHQATRAAAEKARKLKTGWIWFNVFLGLLIVWFVIGKIFRLI